jgi:hypothetical protein
MTRAFTSLAMAGLAGTLTACTPTLDWREVRPEGSAVRLMMPCKPASHARTVSLADRRVEMSMYACTAGDVTYAVAIADMADPAAVTPALGELARSARANLRASDSAASSALSVPGMTPNAQAAQWRIDGRLPDGRQVQEQMAVFAHGTRVHQATMVGPRIDAEARDTFFSGLAVGR